MGLVYVSKTTPKGKDAMGSLQLMVSGQDKDRRALARHAIRWFEKEHLVLPPYASTFMYVGIVSNLEEAGCVEEDTEEDEDERCFRMLLNRAEKDWKLFLVTVMHEMIHVKQMASRELEMNTLTRYRAFWKGSDYSNAPYSRQPWERQAYRLEMDLVKEYCSAYGHKVFRVGECAC